ncbi:UNVERIFIED_CONTAM: hypothetical protein Slati_3078200 [Sesamum latifolium]|uniref:Reverse transcriptase domain-containing protein n=1 Tax=Sesamum latifolium TaxID=2727402 RepID=A0AAW2UUL6_9LAMI
MTIVYGVNDLGGRRVLWQHLSNISRMIADIPWLVGGDFNTVLDISEVSGQSGDIRSAAEDFQACLHDTGLINLPMQGEWFTWHNCSSDTRSLWKIWTVSWLMIVGWAPGRTHFMPASMPVLQTTLLLCCQDLINEFIAFYHELLGSERRVRLIDLCYLRPWARHIINEDEAIQLTRRVTPDEIKQAVFDIDEDKAPGPDGYSSGFFKVAWPVIGKEVTLAILDFFTTGRLLKQVNATLLLLIPKVQNPTLVAEFRPISCCNVLYKVIIKIIVQRLSGVLDDLISPSQNAFVPGRSIGDNILLAQELFHGYNQQHLPPRCVLKVDIRKAYDTVEWDFRSAVLKFWFSPTVYLVD